MADRFLEEAKAFKQEAEEDPASAIEKLPALAYSYVSAKRYRDSLTDVKEIIAAYDKVDEGRNLRSRALFLIMGSPAAAAKDIEWRINEAEKLEDRLLAEVG